MFKVLNYLASSYLSEFSEANLFMPRPRTQVLIERFAYDGDKP